MIAIESLYPLLELLYHTLFTLQLQLLPPVDQVISGGVLPLREVLVKVGEGMHQIVHSQLDEVHFRVVLALDPEIVHGQVGHIQTQERVNAWQLVCFAVFFGNGAYLVVLGQHDGLLLLALEVFFELSSDGNNLLLQLGLHRLQLRQVLLDQLLELASMVQFEMLGDELPRWQIELLILQLPFKLLVLLQLNSKNDKDERVDVLIRELLAVPLHLGTGVDLDLLVDLEDGLLEGEVFGQVVELGEGIVVVEDADVLVIVRLRYVAPFQGTQGHGDIRKIKIDIAEIFLNPLLQLLVNGVIHLQDRPRPHPILERIHGHLLHNISPDLIIVLLLLHRHIHRQFPLSDQLVLVPQLRNSVDVLEEGATSQHLIENETRTPDIAAFVVVDAVVDLGRLVEGSASTNGVDHFVMLGQSEVSDLDVVELVQEYVGRFEVAMQDGLIVQEGQSFQQLSEPFQHQILGNLLLPPDSILDRLRAQLGEKVDGAVQLGRTQVFQDVFVGLDLQFLQNIPLPQYQALFLPEDIGEDPLDGDHLAGLNVAALEDLREAALVDGLEFVEIDALGDLRKGFIVLHVD